MKKERLIVLLGVLVALVFFYLGLNEWLKTREENVQQEPIAVNPLPQNEEAPQAQQPPALAEPEPKPEANKQEDQQEMNQAPKTKEQDAIAQKIVEEKKTETPQKVKEGEKVAKEKQEIKESPKTKEQASVVEKTQEEKSKRKAREDGEGKKVEKATIKTYTVQVGAFVNEEGAKKTAEKARKMGYTVNIIEEDNFYKVRVLVKTGDIYSELRKLKGVFGGAIVKQ